MDRAIYSTAAKQCFVRGINNRINIQCRDIGRANIDPVHDQIHFRQRNIAIGINVVMTIKAHAMG